MNSIVSVCTGDKYPDRYVEILYNMCSRHADNFKFFCLTDRPRQLNQNIHQVIIDKNNLWPSWWNKIHIFNKHMPFVGRVLYMDLDVVIFRNINKLWDFGNDNFVIIQDFNRCRIKNYHVKNSSVMKWNHGTQHELYQKFVNDHNQIMRKWRGDQDYITHMLPNAVIWPTEWIMSYKWEIGLEPGEKRNSNNDKFVSERYTTKTEMTIKDGQKIMKNIIVKHNLPDGCSIAVFHGKPNPAEITKDPLVIDNWR